MPRANGSLGNCYRVSIHGRLSGYFPSMSHAEHYIRACQELNDIQYREEDVKIEKWFIEGEF